MAESHIVGCILGTAVGDALGLPYEGLSRRRARRLLGPPDIHRFLFRRGMVSDDTEHTCMVAQSLIASGRNPETFCRTLGWRFRFWLLGLPAGIGLATLRAVFRLWLAKGVSGYAYHSVPVAIHAWFAHPRDFRSAVTSVICCGGDTDSTAAIAGGIVGAAVGKNGIPEDWLRGLAEWPRSASWMEIQGIQLATTVSSDATARPVGLPLWGLLPRNLCFLIVVLCHGFRRLFPPY